MTRTAHARLAGFTFLFYIAVGVAALMLSNAATTGDDITARFARIAQHTTELRVTVLLNLLCVLSALVLGMTLYAITRDENHELALLGFACRVGEGVVGSFPLTTLGLVWLSTSSGPGAPDAATAAGIGAFLMKVEVWQTTTAATLFAAGSTVFCYLLLRGRLIPIALAWLGVVASIVLLAGLPLQLAGFLRGPATVVMWLPMLAFEVPAGVWLLVKGVAAPARGRARDSDAA
jgi:Domain of unknown function (DUF4386)